jgi:hypothetical protein
LRSRIGSPALRVRAGPSRRSPSRFTGGRSKRRSRGPLSLLPALDLSGLRPGSLSSECGGRSRPAAARPRSGPKESPLPAWPPDSNERPLRSPVFGRALPFFRVSDPECVESSTARDMRSTAIVRPLRSWVALRSMRLRVVAASAAISARKAETCLRRRSGVDGLGGARRGAASRSNRFSAPRAPRSGRPGIARPRFSRCPPLRVRGRSPDPPCGGDSMATTGGASKSTFASLASFTPS